MESHWQIGAGSTVLIFDDRWIPHPTSFKVLTPNLCEEDFWLVSFVLSRIGGMRLCRKILWKEDADIVLSISTSYRFRDDTFCCHYTHDGEYTVKSGYKVGMNIECSIICLISMGNGFDWKRIWRINLPTKIKVFIWKTCHDWLPTMVSLARRKIHADGLCLLCANSYETTTHVLWGCKKLKKIQSRYGVLRDCSSAKNLDFNDLFSMCVVRLENDELSLLCIVFWRIWFFEKPGASWQRYAGLGKCC
ncbi:hypothetical protein Ddye_004478 [Dipteronia dyeriana]|uniref:Reverse transcriptase zinc-binding domain-containing protein n=1 Tax=Dipteronia dyeriana TaxID=168575 RepID=A0AAE0CWF0_9ROSI|nr:hypothetical protein Ddye_004478 [Dipteronia dyeriana]